MRIGIDVREACRLKPTGKGMWTRGFVSELHRRGHTLVLFSDASRDLWPGAELIVLPGGPLWHLRVARLLRCHTPVDCYVSPTSTIVPSLLGSALPIMPVVHDLISFQPGRHDAKARWIERLTLAKAVAGAAHVFTVSDATRSDLLGRFPSLPRGRVTSIFAGTMRPEVPISSPNGSAIVSIGTLCSRKNQKRLIDAYALLPEELRSAHPLILAGARGWDGQRIVDRVSHVAGVSWRQYVDDEAYDHLLADAAVFALPSLYEGFGLALLDALQRGLPVLTSDRGSLREVCGSAAHYIDPESVPSIAAGLERLLRDPALRLSLRRQGPAQARQFSWRRTVDLFLEAIVSSP